MALIPRPIDSRFIRPIDINSLPAWSEKDKHVTSITSGLTPNKKPKAESLQGKEAFGSYQQTVLISAAAM